MNLKTHAQDIMNADTEYNAQMMLKNVVRQAKIEERKKVIKWAEKQVDRSFDTGLQEVIVSNAISKKDLINLLKSKK